MALRLSGQTSILGVAFFVFKSLLGIEGQKKLKKNNTILTRKPRRDKKNIKGSLEQPHGMNYLHPSLSNLRSGILCKVYNVYLA